VLDVTTAMLLQRPDGKTHAYTRTLFDPGTGHFNDATAVLISGDQETAFATADHPALRAPDGYVAFNSSASTLHRIQTLLFPAQTTAQDAGTPINAARTAVKAEEMPAWSPDGVKLAFVRSTATCCGTRQLLVYDNTPGLQAIVNPGIDLGADPTRQIRDFHSHYGGISLADPSRIDSVSLTCLTACVKHLVGTVGGTGLSPTCSSNNSAQVSDGTSNTIQVGESNPCDGSVRTIGIIVARVVGSHRVLGRKLPKLRPLGRVPLGRSRKGVNRFKWSGRVQSRALGAGEYVITYRALTSTGRVKATSKTIEFRITRKGRIISPRVLR
jgi:WD40-like Beta Propeller Repeat